MPARARLPLALCVLLLAGATANAAFDPGDNLRSLESGGLTRTYRVHVPPSYDGSSPVPLVVDIHGLGSNAAQQEGVSGMKGMSDAHGFLVAYPDGLDNAFNAGTCCGATDHDDVAFIRTMVATVEGEAVIDPSRVYVTGLSNGGAMTQRLACDAADLFAAAAPMAFPIPFAPRTECQPSRSMPVLTFMGLTDVLVRYNGTAFGTAPDTFAYWRDTDACTGQPARVDSGKSYCETYSSCASHTQVGLCSITAQSFPNSSVSGHILYLNPDFKLADVAWTFLSQFTLGNPSKAVDVELAGTARFKLRGVSRRPTKVQWAFRLGDGTWAGTDGAGTIVTGSWSRPRSRAKKGTLVMGTEARAAFQDAVRKQVATLSGASGLTFDLEDLAPFTVRLQKKGGPAAVQGRWRIPAGSLPGAGAGTFSLKLRLAK